jgi:anaerobic magnesium-protoporphyrin IX monomethyl ester cyclase
MKIFLTHSYFYQLDKKQWANQTPYPPLATITALSKLEMEGYQTKFYDGGLDSGPELCIQKIKQEKSDIVLFYEDGFNYLTKMCLTTMRDACFKMLEAAKNTNAITMVSSSDSTDNWKMYHEAGADIIIHGEAEITLTECLKALESNSDLSAVEGISFKHESDFTKNKPRLNLNDLDVLPMAKWTAIDVNKYKSIWKNSKFPFTLNVSTTRGCPFKCNWCAKPIYGNRYNARSPEKVAEEIEFLVNEFGVRHIWMTDDIFGLKPAWVKRFNELIQEKQLKFNYKIQSRADLLLKDETIDELAASGLEEVWIGAESGSQKILDAMDKGTTVAQINECTKLLQSKGVRVAYFLQFGYLGETKKDIQLTTEMVRKNQPDDIGISVSYPLPGTPFYETVKKDLGGKSNWTDSDDLDLMFTGTYDSSYYRNLQRYVHHQFRFQQGGKKWRNWNSFVSWRYAILAPYNLCVAKYLQNKIR